MTEALPEMESNGVAADDSAAAGEGVVDGGVEVGEALLGPQLGGVGDGDVEALDAEIHVVFEAGEDGILDGERFGDRVGGRGGGRCGGGGVGARAGSDAAAGLIAGDVGDDGAEGGVGEEGFGFAAADEIVGFGADVAPGFAADESGGRGGGEREAERWVMAHA